MFNIICWANMIFVDMSDDRILVWIIVIANLASVGHSVLKLDGFKCLDKIIQRQGFVAVIFRFYRRLDWFEEDPLLRVAGGR